MAGASVSRPSASRRPAMSSQDSSSRSVSRPGSTTAPCGSFAMVSISAAVAGIEPVEPAAITGPPVWAASRLASAAISRSRRSAGSILPRSARIAGHASRTISFRKRSVSCQYSSCSPGTSVSSLSHGTCRVVMSSISRASASASASAEAGLLATSGALPSRRIACDAAHLVTSCVSSSRRSRPPSSSVRSSAPGVGGVGEHQLVLVDVADRDDARQDRGVGAGHVEEDVARQPAGAPRRQIERGGGERQRIAGVGKALDQGAVAQRRDQRRHERRRSRNGEDAGGGSSC